MNQDTTKIDMILSIAMVCHAANKAWCEANGDASQKDWDEAEDWQKESAQKGVAFRLDNPNSGNDAQHNAWMKEKIDAGWVYGEVKDAEAKTHPCILPFDQLPEFQQKKDTLFCAIVDALSGRLFEKPVLKTNEVQVEPAGGSEYIIGGNATDSIDPKSNYAGNRSSDQVGTQQLSFGQMAVGLTFNPGKNPAVNSIKEKYAAVIDEINDFRNHANTSQGAKRYCSKAISEAENSQMDAVKAFTWIYE